LLSLLVAAWTVDALLSLPRLGDPQLRPDGAEFAWVQQGKVYLSPIETSVAPKAVHPGSRPRWSPDSKTLAFVAFRNGLAQVYLYDRPTETVREFTHAPSSVSSFSWAPDGKSIGFLAMDAGSAADPEVSGEFPRYGRLFLQALGSNSALQITTGKAHVVSFALSPAGTEAVYAAQKTPHNQDSLQSDLYTVNLRTLATKPLVEQLGRDGDPSYSPDGKWVVFHSQGGTLNYFEKRDVAMVAAVGGVLRYLTRGQPVDVFRNGNIFSWSPDSRSLTYTAGLGVNDILVRQDIASGELTTLVQGIAGAASFSSDRSRAVFLKTSRSHPPEITLLNGNATRQLTHVHDGLQRFPAFSSEVVQWKSRDGLRIEGMLWLPPGYRAGTRVPLLTELHGGPTGTTLDAFPQPSVYPIQAFLENGMAVFSPNFRGSTNYGAAFRMKNAKSQGEGDYDDVMTGIDALIARGIADADRLGVMGWSYGGYLTASIVTQTNRFKAASIGAPAVDWITYYGQSHGPKEVLWTYFGGTPWEVPQSYNRHSPRAKLKHVRTPCLLQVGALDINHNAEIYRALADNHVEAVYTLYPREGHGFVEPAHVRDVMERNLNWFLRWLKK